MTVWNRSYLEAIGLPVWVSRQGAVVDTTSSVHDVHTETKSELSAEASVDIRHETNVGFVLLSGNTQAKAFLLATANEDLEQLQKNFKVLQQVWTQWQDTELPLALVKLVEQSDSITDFESVKSLKGKRVLLSTNQPAELASLTIEHVPSLNWQSADDKKGWWQLLQSLV